MATAASISGSARNVYISGVPYTVGCTLEAVA